MAELFTSYISSVWAGLDIPLFDLGITFKQFYLGVFVVGIAISVFTFLFGVGSPSYYQRQGRNKRKGQETNE